MIPEAKSLKQRLENQCATQILLSVETQLNAIPPSGDSFHSHQKQKLYAKLFGNSEDVTEEYGNKITFRELRERRSALQIYIN